jgi:hypothetical protein
LYVAQSLHVELKITEFYHSMRLVRKRLAD